MKNLSLHNLFVENSSFPHKGLVMPHFKDKRYLGFKSIEGFDPIEKEEFQVILDNVKHRHKDAARALIILLYYSGCRPVEALQLTRQSFKKEGNKLWVVFPAAKDGTIGSIMFQAKNQHIKELSDYSLRAWAPGYPIFFRLRGKGRRIVSYEDKKKGIVVQKEYNEITRNVRYFVKKASGTVPYFFRHNRFSKASALGANIQELMELKRAKREASCYPYLHFSKERKAKLGKYVKD